MSANKSLSSEADGQRGCVRLVPLGEQANKHPGNGSADSDVEIGCCALQKAKQANDPQHVR